MDTSQFDEELATAQASQIYTKLNQVRTEIRVLRLQPSDNYHETPRCRLDVVSLASETPPEHEAVSYCWGECSGSAPVWVNGVLHDAPASSVSVLRRFRHFKEVRTLWIDALCINQRDIVEKQCQIPLMGRI